MVHFPKFLFCWYKKEQRREPLGLYDHKITVVLEVALVAADTAAQDLEAHTVGQLAVLQDIVVAVGTAFGRTAAVPVGIAQVLAAEAFVAVALAGPAPSAVLVQHWHCSYFRQQFEGQVGEFRPLIFRARQQRRLYSSEN